MNLDRLRGTGTEVGTPAWLLIAITYTLSFQFTLQALALKLGVVAERDLAQCCRDAYPRWLNYCLWILSEVLFGLSCGSIRALLPHIKHGILLPPTTMLQGRCSIAAQACIPVSLPMQIAIAATDLAEIIGSATALYLLFGLPVWAGVLITGVVSVMPIKSGIRYATRE